MISAIVFALAVLQAPTADCRADSAQVKSIRAVADGIIAADNVRDIERVIGFYAKDAWLMPPNSSPLQGLAAIRPGYEMLFAGFNPAIEGHIHQACVSGAVAYVRGHNGGRMNSRSNGPARELDDDYIMLLRLDGRRGWRITHLIWHSAH